MTELQFGRVQLRIMQVLWEKKRATALEITEELNKVEPIAHNNVQLLLRILEKKNAIAHDIDKRTFIYYPLKKEKKVINGELCTLIDTVFAGSVRNLVSSLLKNRSITREELDKIFEMLEEEEK